MQQHLREAVNPFIELLVRHRGIVKVHLMAHHEARLRTSADDEVAEISIICLDVALAGTQAQTLLEQLAKAQQYLALARLLVGRAWVRRDVQAWNTKPTSGSGDHDQLVKDNVWLLLVSALVDSLVADSVYGAVNHSVVLLDDLLHWIALCEIDRDASAQ